MVTAILKRGQHRIIATDVDSEARPLPPGEVRISEWDGTHYCSGALHHATTPREAAKAYWRRYVGGHYHIEERTL